MAKSTHLIEQISESEDGLWVQIGMRETRPWDGSGERRIELETRINNCLAYVLEGQLQRDFPRYANKRVRIELLTTSSPDPDTRTFLARVTDFCRAEGLEFRVTVSEGDSS